MTTNQQEQIESEEEVQKWLVSLESGQAAYIDLVGKKHPVTWKRVFEAVDRIRIYFQAINRRFVEREDIIKQIMYAMMMREHIMINGPTGAAKSRLSHVVFSGIKGAILWKMNLTKFTTMANLFGNYDVVKMKKTGQMVHMTEASLAKANLAVTGEFCDANDAVLRSLLGALYERVIHNGPQVMRPPLISVMADTNFAPGSLTAARREYLAAVFDRFLFQSPVAYVQKPSNRLTMLEMSLDTIHSTELPPVTLKDFVIVSGVIQGMNLVEDRYVVQAYEEATRLFSLQRVKDGSIPLSDRRFVNGAQIMEVSALLDGRTGATFEDLALTSLVLAHSEQEEELYDKVRREIMGEWVEKASRHELEAELFELEKVTADIPKQPNLSTMQISELRRLTSQLDETLENLYAYRQNSAEVGRQQIRITNEMGNLRNDVHIQLIKLLSEHMPSIPDEVPVEHLMQLKQQVGIIESQLRDIIPSADRVRKSHDELYEIILAASSKLQVAFDLSGTLAVDIEETTEGNGDEEGGE